MKTLPQHPLIPAALLGLALLCASISANAQNYGDVVDQAKDYLYLGIGDYDSFGNDTALDIRAELRPHAPVIGELKPFAAANVTHEGTTWIGGGLLYDLEIAEDWNVTPGLGAGYYNQGGSDLDLGGALQLRGQMDVSYQYDNKSRVMGYVSTLTDLSDESAESIGVMVGFGF